MNTFYLIRHGAKEALFGDPPLTQLGQFQAAATAQRFTGVPIAAIYASPLLRTQQTAHLIAASLGTPVIRDPRLTERMNWGGRDGESIEDFYMQWDMASLDRHYQPPHGDSAYATGRRIEAFLLEATARYHDQHIIVVTHGGAIGDFLQNVFDDLPLATSATGVSYVEILECSITTITHDRDGFAVERLGDISHLSELLTTVQTQ